MSAVSIHTATLYGSTPAYIYQVDYQPAFVLKMLAYAMSDNGMPTFLVVDMPVGFDSARLALEAYYLTGSINKAHYLESYYLLATKQS